ncbi:MAG: ABC transporter ATP-binding protein [Gammaproteobacteria bacterium]|nr:ABC transporter ATP-binding protein [Gammaproteobacteria bacterium]MDH3447123.1 ABC transporter ATP-binding protein [Gammaproteobacteria bacterium]
MSFLVLKNISKRYGPVAAVEDFSLDVEKGEFISLLGPSGCGKTTTLQMIAGFEEPTAGSISVDGRDMTSVPPNARDIGIVFQSYALFPHMTVADNVAFGLEMRNVPKQERQQRVAETLSMVGLEEFAGRFPKALSGGQRQRVALARAIVIKPQLLLLDEPLSALDAKIRESMQIELRNIQHTVGVTTILVTHDQAEAMAMSDRIAVMNKARLAQLGAPFEIYESPGDSFTSNFLGSTNMFEGKVNSASDGNLSISCAGVELSVPGQAKTGEVVTLGIRPEKIALVGAGEGLLNATVHTRIFLGTSWLYQIDSELGRMSVTLQNTGRDVALEGDTVGLNWQREAVRVLREEQVA